MADLLQEVVTGLGDGVIYAGLALALVLIHRCSGSVNFAQGELAMLAVFGAWAMTEAGLNVWLATAVAVGASAVLGMALQAGLMSRFASADHSTVAIVTLGLMFIPAGLAGEIWGYIPKSFPSLFGDGSLSAFGITIGHEQLGGMLLLLAAAAALALLLTRTKTGLGIRAAALNPDSSRLVGVPVERMLMLGWGLACAIGAMAGIVAAPTLFVTPTMMLPILLYAFAAASLGGFDSMIGAVVGGLTVGVVEVLAGSYIPGIGSELKLVAALAVIVVVLVVRPEGLFTARKVERV